VIAIIPIKYNNTLLSFGPLKYSRSLSGWGAVPSNPCMVLLLYTCVVENSLGRIRPAKLPCLNSVQNSNSDSVVSISARQYV